MQILIVGDGFFDIPFEAVHRQVHAAELDGIGDLLLAMNRQFRGRVLLVFSHEAGALDEHAAGSAGRVQDAAVIGLQDFDQQAHDAGWRVELAALLPFRPGEFAEEVFVDASEGVVVDGGGDFGDALEEFFQERAGEDFVCLGQYPAKLRIVLFNVAHRFIDRLAGIASLGQMQEPVEAGVGSEIEHPFGMVSRRIVQAGATARGGCGLFQRRSLFSESSVGEAQEDEPEDRGRVLRRSQTAIGTKLVRGGPQAIFQCVG